jgi:SAM-dependent methyltransferase
MSRRLLRRAHTQVSAFAVDPKLLIDKWRALPIFARNLVRYGRANRSKAFRLRMPELFFTSYERFGAAGSIRTHYFHQDLWAARHLRARGVTRHVDVGSRIDGFVAHLLPFCEVEYVDIRPLEVPVEGLTVRVGSILDLPYESGSVPSLSCLHVIEHIGLGRYGDPIDPEGHMRSARELARVLAPGGLLLLGTPVGRERLCFDAHRVFDPATVLAMFDELELVEFAYIDDDGSGVRTGAMDQVRQCEFGCGLFVFRKPPITSA